MRGPHFRNLYTDHLIGDNATIEARFTGAWHTDLYTGMQENRPVALKHWRVPKNVKGRSLHRLLEGLTKKLDEWRSVSSHPNILPLIGLLYDGEPVPLLVMPRSRWHIAEYIEQNPHTDRLVLLGQLSKALSYLHNQELPIVHGNIRDTNVLVSENHRVLLSDIGMNEFFLVPEVSREWVLINRPHWQPPEQLIMRESKDLQTSCDVWSFGMVVLQAFTGNIPYHHLPNAALVTLNIAQGVLPQRPDSIDGELWQVLENCWKYNPHDRPSMNVISPWIRLVREQQRIRL